MYGAKDILPAVRSDAEKKNAHPAETPFRAMHPGQSFSSDEVREAVIPAYMGLISQVDDALGKLFQWLEETNRSKNTVIVFTSDHGDYLGDHWMGEKELFHDASAKVPLIIYDPRTQADATRGSRVDELVEAIDLAPTFVELAGLPKDDQWLDGRSLVPFLTNERLDEWREYVFSELDYAFYGARNTLGLGQNDAHIAMIASKRYKYIHYQGFRPQLYDLQQDPNELNDLGRSDTHVAVRAEFKDHLLEKLMTLRHRTTESDASVNARTGAEEDMGIYIGRWE